MKYFFIILFLFSIIIYGKEKNYDFTFNSSRDEAVTRPTTNKAVTRPTTNKAVTRPTTNKAVTRPTTNKAVTRPTTDDKEDEDNGMDFSNIVVESDDLDEEVEKQEEKEIDEEISKTDKKNKIIDLKELKKQKEYEKKKNELFLSFLKLQMKINYRNLMLFDNIPYQHSPGLELTSSIMGIELKNANAYLGEIGYRISYNSDITQSLIISPLMINFNFRNWGQVLPFNVNIFKIYFFKETVRGNNNKTINLFFEYISLSMSWRFFKDEDFSSNIFLGISLGPDDIKSNPKRESMVFTIGISGNFLPIKIKF